MDRAKTRRQIVSLEELLRTRDERIKAFETNDMVARLDQEIVEYRRQKTEVLTARMRKTIARLEAEEVRP